MFDASTSRGIIAEAVFIQFPFWFLFFAKFKSWMMETFEGRDWYEAVGRQKGGKSEWILYATAFPQHFFAGICLYLTLWTGNHSYFVHGILSEWAYETIDVVKQTIAYLGGEYDDNEDGGKAFLAVLFHHVPGVITIIPATIYLGQEKLFHDVVFSLLGMAWFMLIAYCLGKTYDLTDLQQRTRYTVMFFTNYLMILYTRLYLFPRSMYRMAMEHFSKASWFLIFLGIVYGILMTLFNLLFVVITGERLMKLSYGSEKEKTGAGRSLQRQSFL